jgi:hypothetical protein
MSTMRPIRSIATVLLVASVAVAGCGKSQPDQRDTVAKQPPAATAPATSPPAVSAPPATQAPPKAPARSEPVVLADGRHPVYLKTIDPSRRTITFDLMQFYGGEEAVREAAKDHPEVSPDDLWHFAPNDYYIRNVNPKLRTLPVRVDATITVITLAWQGHNYSDDNVPVSLAKLANYMPSAGHLPFWITVRHDQVVKIAEQYVP